MLYGLSREQLEALGYTFVKSDLPPIVREWSVGDAVLCATLSEFDYSDHEAWKKLNHTRLNECFRVIGSLVV